MPTQEEIDAQKKKEADDKRNMLESLWDGVKGFFGSFGSLFTIAIVAVGAYFLSTTEWGKNLLGGLMDKIPEWIGKLNPEWGQTVKGWMDKLRVGMGADGALGDYLEKMDAATARTDLADKVSPTVLNIVAKDDATWKAFIKNAKDANGGKLSKAEDLTSGPAVLSLLINQPTMVKNLFGALNPALNPNQSAADKEMWSKNLMAQARDLVNGPKFDQLLGKANRAATFDMIAKFAPADPKNPITADGLEKQFTSLGMIDKDGNPTPAMKKALGNVIDALDAGQIKDFNGVMPIIMKSVDTTNPDVRKNFLDAALPTMGTMMGGTKNAALFRQSLGDERLSQFLPIAQGGDAKAQAQFLMSPANLPALKQFANTVDISTLPQGMQAQMTMLASLPKEPLLAVAKNGVNALDLQAIFTQQGKSVPDASFVMTQMLFDANQRVIRQAGVDNVAALMRASAPTEYQAMLSNKNVELMTQVANMIGSVPNTADGHVATRNVVSAMTDLMMGNATPFSKLPTAQIQIFFSNATNNKAMKLLLDHIEGLSGGDAKMVDLLRQNWGNNPNEKFGALLTDKDGVELLKKELASGTKSSGMWDNFLHSDFVLSTYLSGIFQDDKISMNKETLIALGHVWGENHPSAPVTPAKAPAHTTLSK